MDSTVEWFYNLKCKEKGKYKIVTCECMHQMMSWFNKNWVSIKGKFGFQCKRNFATLEQIEDWWANLTFQAGKTV